MRTWGCVHYSFLFFFNDTATTEIYTLSLHDALPISQWMPAIWIWFRAAASRIRCRSLGAISVTELDRKSTRLNSSHGYISYAVFCLKKKKPLQTRDHELLYDIVSAFAKGPAHHLLVI